MMIVVLPLVTMSLLVLMSYCFVAYPFTLFGLVLGYRTLFPCSFVYLFVLPMVDEYYYHSEEHVLRTKSLI